MKILTIITLILSNSALANYALRTEVESKSITKVFTKKPKSGNYIKLPAGYNANSYDVVDEEIDDMEKPNYEAKSSVEACESLEDCKEKELALSCDDINGYFKVRTDEDVYCTKIVSYKKKLSGRKTVKEDAAKKALVMQAMAKKQAVSDKLKDMNFGRELYASVQVLNRSKGLSKADRRQLRVALKTMRDDLFDGNICEVREDLVILAADGVKIKESDKTALLSIIDKYKTCE